MWIKEVKVKKFRNVLDTGWVELQPNITALVGKNESGKTTILQAINKLFPADEVDGFSIQDHYPAWLEKQDRMEGINQEEVTPIELKYQLEDHELTSLEEKFGKGILTSNTIKVSKKYNNQVLYSLDASHEKFIKHLLKEVNWAKGTKTEAKNKKNIKEFEEYADNLIESEDEEYNKTGKSLKEFLEERNLQGGNTITDGVWKFLKGNVPKTLYFNKYSTLPYSVDIKRVLQNDTADLTEGEKTAKALLKLAAAEDEYLQEPDYERRKRELENIANYITQDVLKYWSQNPNLRVQPDISKETVNVNGGGQRAVLDELKILVWDQRHMLSLPFTEHSAGFQWFFSFLAAFSEYEMSNKPITLLLDEPALGLHAKAQDDFLRFIEERLGAKRQVLYTTHSPFMIQPGKLENVRMVEDKSIEDGAVVTKEVASIDKDTLFPLQSALGYDLVQNLFIAPHNVVIEGTSDYAYLKVISDYFASDEINREPLNERWSLVPVGGVDLVPTFVALLGNRLDVTVLVDAKKGGHQKLNQLSKEGILSSNRILTIGNIINSKTADIEDMFEIDEYLALYNEAFNKTIQANNLQGNDPIVKRIERLEGSEFNHGLPADVFLRKRDKKLPSLSQTTLDRFENLFKKVNQTLESS